MTAPALRLVDVHVEREGRRTLELAAWEVGGGERWVVLGPNGSGKTTLVQICALYLHPSAGEVWVLGERLGRTDVRELRKRIGYVSSALTGMLRPHLTAADVVISARHAALAPWWHRYGADDHERAQACLGRFGVGSLGNQAFGSLSSGEQQRVLLARAFMRDPILVLLDEPTARLDLGGREQVVAALTNLADDANAPPLVLVTHHVDEIPTGFGHALLLKDGRSVASGEIDEALTATTLSDTFGLPLALEHRPNGRRAAWLA